MGFWIEATREIFTSVIFKTHQFQNIRVIYKIYKKVCYKFRNRTKRNTTFIVVIKADSRKKKQMKLSYLFCHVERRNVSFARTLSEHVFVKFDTNERDRIKTLKLVLDKTI